MSKVKHTFIQIQYRTIDFELIYFKNMNPIGKLFD